MDDGGRRFDRQDSQGHQERTSRSIARSNEGNGTAVVAWVPGIAGLEERRHRCGERMPEDTVEEGETSVSRRSRLGSSNCDRRRKLAWTKASVTSVARQGTCAGGVCSPWWSAASESMNQGEVMKTITSETNAEGKRGEF
jgi:hypothetical protein